MSQTPVLIAVEMTLSGRMAAFVVVDAVFTRTTAAVTRTPDEKMTLSWMDMSGNERLLSAFGRSRKERKAMCGRKAIGEQVETHM